ncbi:MAG TPA: restriction endonuclease [Candidatus Methanoperedens sp.]
MVNSFNWNSISAEKFEQLCALLLECNHFTNLQWFGKHGMDKGRDLVAENIVNPLPNITEVNKWLVQCKRYITKPPSKSEINEWLISCKEHNPEYVLLIITNTLSANTKDWLRSVETQFPFKIMIWEERDILKQIIEKNKLIKEHFPRNIHFWRNNLAV